MRILAINTGSSSIKFSVFDTENDCQIFKSQTTYSNQAAYSNTEFRIKAIVKTLKDNGFDNFDAIGHRVVHGGLNFSEPKLINEIIIAELKSLIPLAPLHQPYNIAAIEIFAKLYPNITQFACFDTAFHRTMAEENTLFALPQNFAKEGVIRYGFHGLSYEYITSILPNYAKENANQRVIVAHLGNGASMCAIKNLKSVATTMGFSVLDGLMMGTRCGNIDPGIILYLLKEKHMPVQEISKLLYEKSGLKGVSGLSGDVRDLISSNNLEAKKAINMFCNEAAKQLSGLLPTIGGLDILVFTAGIGENSALIRKNICKKLSWLGVEIDNEANNLNQEKISTNKSKVEIYVIPTNEEKIIAQKIKGENERQ